MITTDATGRGDALGLPAETHPVEIHTRPSSDRDTATNPGNGPESHPAESTLAAHQDGGANAATTDLGGETGQRGVTTPRVGGLFAGAGMLDHAVHHTLGATPAWFVENDPAARKVLAHHWPHVPNHGDITHVNWADVEPVDVLCGGFPCQDISSAGLRTGLRPGTRSGLWSHMAYAISQLKPKLVIIENVRGLLSADANCDLEPCPWCLGDNEGRPLRALGAVLGDLASIGYVGQWRGLRASDAGAPHGRFRVFITAWPVSDSRGVNREGWPSAGLKRRTRSTAGPAADTDGLGSVRGWGTRGRWDGLANHSEFAADPCGAGCGPRSGLGRPAGATVERNGAPTAADATGIGRGEGWPESAGFVGGSDAVLSGDGASARWGSYEPAIRRWELILGRPVPAPTQIGQRGGQQLSPRFTEWLMGWPDGWVTSIPGLSRNDQLKICGNGVVPQQCAAALRLLLADVVERAA